jgi:hypothetical protein
MMWTLTDGFNRRSSAARGSILERLRPAKMIRAGEAPSQRSEAILAPMPPGLGPVMRTVDGNFCQLCAIGTSQVAVFGSLVFPLTLSAYACTTETPVVLKPHSREVILVALVEEEKKKKEP